MATPEASRPLDFVRQIVADDLAAGKYSRIMTRFPPEPNGYLHIGHAKSICLNFGIAQEFGGLCNLRFDDTNPTKEEQEYVDSIMADVRWLGFDWDERLFFASDYFDQMYDYGLHLIKTGKAFVCSLTAEQIREYRGTLTEPGKESPYRNRSIEENLDLFTRMQAGEFPDGAHVLRAKIDMASGNINMRDPVLYRILHAEHHRTGAKWCLYPMYDYAHPISDALEGITHSICTLEFEDHRPLYDWTLDNLPVPYRPYQYEFARLNLTYTVLSKRRLIKLVQEGHVAGWDDPRLPTISGIRRRGYPAACGAQILRPDRGGETGKPGGHSAPGVLRPGGAQPDRAPGHGGALPPQGHHHQLPRGQVEELQAVNNPEDPEAGTRQVPFSRELYIEREDFMEDPPKKFYRLAPGREVRLRYAYYLKCEEVVKDGQGNIVELRCTYDPETRGGYAPDGRKVKATLHWVSAPHARPATVRLYDRLFTVPEPGAATGNFLDDLNPHSLDTVATCRVEPSLTAAQPGERCQFERLGYFCVDPDSVPTTWSSTAPSP